MQYVGATVNPMSQYTVENLVPPQIFNVFSVLGTIVVAICIFLSIQFAPAAEPMFHFGENGAITALSSVCTAMAGAMALAVFYLRWHDLDFGSLFWLVLAGGCVFLSLDEQLMFHERGGHLIEATSIGEAETFRNWNDPIVMAYGVIATGIAALFGREVLKCRAFAVLFAIGFGFYVLHTGIDSILPSSVAWKDIPEESAKLLSVFCLFLATCAQLTARLDKLLNAPNLGRIGI